MLKWQNIDEHRLLSFLHTETLCSKYHISFFFCFLLLFKAIFRILFFCFLANDISDICWQSSTLLDELTHDIIESNSARVLEILDLLDCGHYSHSVTCSRINTSSPENKNKRKVLCLYVFLTPMLNDLSPKRQFYNVIGQSLSVSGVNDA